MTTTPARPDGGDFAIQNQQVGNDIEAVGGVNYASAGQEQRIHRAGSLATPN